MLSPVSIFANTTQLTRQQNQVLALAAVFQATQLVHIIATAGSNHLGDSGQKYARLLLQTALNIRSGNNPNQNSLVFFQHIHALKLGLKTLEQSLVMPYDPHPKAPPHKIKRKSAKPALNYAMALLHLSAKVYRQPNFATTIEKKQRLILKQLAFFNYDYQHPSIIAALAQIYSETASTLSPKIMIKGSKLAFQDQHDVALIRALLFSGLQIAHYWRGLGGTPWKLILSKSKILREIRYFAELQHLEQQTEANAKSL